MRNIACYAPIRSRRDGSIYFEKSRGIKTFLAEAATTFLLVILFVATIMFAFVS